MRLAVNGEITGKILFGSELYKEAGLQCFSIIVLRQHLALQTKVGLLLH